MARCPLEEECEEGGMSMRRANRAVGDVMAAALVVASGVSHLRFRVLQ
jgi:hypothetical protein